MPRHKHADAGIEAARDLRQRLSPPERALWSRLRSSKLGGLKFRRQYPLGPYVCDFYCDEARLVVEVDGRVHESRSVRDHARDVYLRSQGVKVVRVSASLVSAEIETVLRLILKEAGSGE